MVFFPAIVAFVRLWSIRKKNLRPDAQAASRCIRRSGRSGGTLVGHIRSQRETHRQCEFGRSTPFHRAFARRMLGRSASGHSSPWHLLTGRRMSGQFPSGRSRVRAFSFGTQPCQGIFLLDAAMSDHFPSGRSRVRANGVRTKLDMGPRSRCLSMYRTS